jgi:putative spermidine/putrescine transport system ATP-binding protein
MHKRSAADGIPGTVHTSSFLGSVRRTAVRLGDDTVVQVQHEASDSPEPGAPVSVQIAAASVSVSPV